MATLSFTALKTLTRYYVKQRLQTAANIEDLRKTASAFDGMFNSVPKRIEVIPASLPHCDAEWIRPKEVLSERVLLYFPGGAFMLRTPKTHRVLVARIAREAHCRALLVFYRLAPEHQFPAGLEDCIAAYERVLKAGVPPECIVFGGDSAGGNLVLASLMALRDRKRPLPAGAFALSPVTDLRSHRRGSRTSNADLDPLLPNATKRKLDRTLYTGNLDKTSHPYASPILGDFTGLPPLLFHVGSTEILLDDSTLAAQRAVEAGVDARVQIWEEMMHVWHLTPLKETARAIGCLADFVRQCAP